MNDLVSVINTETVYFASLFLLFAFFCPPHLPFIKSSSFELMSFFPPLIIPPQTFWTYIKGMLQNLDCLPLERIYSMLQMFAIQGPESGEFTQAHLKAFLDRKVKEQQLIQGGGVYRLPKH